MKIWKGTSIKAKNQPKGEHRNKEISRTVRDARQGEAAPTCRKPEGSMQKQVERLEQRLANCAEERQSRAEQGGGWGEQMGQRTNATADEAMSLTQLGCLWLSDSQKLTVYWITKKRKKKSVNILPFSFP